MRGRWQNEGRVEDPKSVSRWEEDLSGVSPKGYEQYTQRAAFWETVIAGEYQDEDGGMVITAHDKKSALKLHDAAVELIRLIGLKDFKMLRKQVRE